MRTLSATLTAAQQSNSAIPYVKVSVYDSLAAIARARFTSLYTGAEADLHGHAQILASGNLVRCRVDGSGNAYWQRIGTPGPGSSFGTWGSAVMSSRSAGQIAHSGATVGWVNLSTGGAVYWRHSTNEGQGWPSQDTIVASGAAHCCGALKSTTAGAAFYAASNQLFARTGNPTTRTWAAAVAGPTFATITGLAVAYAGDYNLLVTGSDAAGPGVFQVIFGDGYSATAGTWGTPTAIHRAASGGPTTYAHPSLASADTWRAAWLETYTGPVAYTRALMTYTIAAADFVDARWREPWPVDWTIANAPPTLTANLTASYLWLTTPGKVWRAPLSSSATDLTDYVLSATVRDAPLAARATVVLDNAAGAFLGAGATPLTAGMALEVDLGYTTSAGDEVPGGSPMRLQVAAVHHRAVSSAARGQAQGRAATILEAVSPWAILDAWTAPRQFRWAAGDLSYYNLLAFVVARCGYSLSTRGTTSAMLTAVSPAFAIHPGTSALAAFRALLERLPEVALVEGSTVYLLSPTAGDASGYSFGGAHGIEESDLQSALAPAAHTRAVGTGITAEALLESQIELVSHRLATIATPEISDATSIQEAAAGLLRKSTMATPAGRIVLPPHCGAQLWDVVDITQAAAGWSARSARIIGIETTYERRTQPLYQQKLTLGEV